MHSLLQAPALAVARLSWPAQMNQAAAGCEAVVVAALAASGASSLLSSVQHVKIELAVTD